MRFLEYRCESGWLTFRPGLAGIRPVDEGGKFRPTRLQKSWGLVDNQGAATFWWVASIRGSDERAYMYAVAGGSSKSVFERNPETELSFQADLLLPPFPQARATAISRAGWRTSRWSHGFASLVVDY
ncbi:hypothetical protein CU100_15995 [Phyllobacterium endophyticum]|uniref:Uncharacterized protein n=1 Tax=Phyllobacterium endophyticum TaxID=1149773 RepID=A0A2P7ARH8_9HYPH|nr:hypothetical protein CU100_15995 [Phyllobacterium endophyticum]